MSAKRQPIPKDWPSEDGRRDAQEVSLLSLLDGFQHLHRITNGEMCQMLLGICDWLACPNVATRIRLADQGDDQADLCHERRGG